MALILNLETSTKNCSVSISNQSEILCLCEEFNEQYSHAKKLHEFIQFALEGANAQLKDLQAVCVSKGPGSYTGLRIGVAAAKAFCYALKIPLLSVESLDVLAQVSNPTEYDLIVPMIDARRNEVYTKLFNSKLKVLQPTESKILSEFSYANFNTKKLLFIGNGAKKAQEILSINSAEFRAEVHVSAKQMADLAYVKFKNQYYEDLAYFEPFYLKDFIAGKPKKML